MLSIHFKSRLSISILLNVARHSDLAVLIAVEFDATDVVVDLLQMFRDKHTVFNLACELLSCMVQANEVVKELCNGSELRKRLDSIQHILERKSRLDARVQGVTMQIRGGAAGGAAAAGGNSKSSFELMRGLISKLDAN